MNQAEPSSQNAYRELFERSADAILIIEGEMFIECNDAAVRMLRCTDRAEVLSTHPSELSPPKQPDGRDSFEKANEMIATAFERGSHRFEWAHLRADGEVFPVEVLLTAVQEPNRRILHVVWRDITERKRLEDGLRHAHKMEAVGKLAGGIAHDFNNLLVIILGHSELLEGKLEGNEKLLHHVRQIMRSSERAADLVKQLLAFGRKQALSPQVLDVDGLVADLRLLLERLIGEDIHLQTTPCDTNPHVKADRTQIEQVLMNLVSNARDAMPRGGVLSLVTREVSVQADDIGRVEDLDPGDYALITVSDTGVGMDADTSARAFDPFFTTKEQGKGTGLGLATVHGIVQQSGGAVTIYSAPGHGTTVKVYLPLTGERRPVRPAERLTDQRSGGSETVLVVEDEPSVSALVVTALRAAGYKVHVAANGQQALQLYGEYGASIELVLSDVIMPVMGGPEMVAHLRATGHEPAVLFMSGYTDDALSRFTDLTDEIDLVEKPFATGTLLRRVRAALDR